MTIRPMTVETAANMAALTVVVKKMRVNLVERVSYHLLFSMPGRHLPIQNACIPGVTAKTTPGLVTEGGGVGKKIGTTAMTIDTGRAQVRTGYLHLMATGAVPLFRAAYGPCRYGLDFSAQQQ